MNDFNSRQFRDVLSCFATGITVVTTNHQGKALGMTVNSFTSVSLEPPLVLWCLSKDTVSFDAFSNARHYNIQILNETQENLSNKFANPEQNKFDGVQWQSDERGLPYIQNCKTTLHCNQEAIYEGGDHLILLSRVIEISEMSEEKPLIFAEGKYSRLQD